MATRIRITRKHKTLSQENFFCLLNEFISDTSTGKRHKKNGAKISQSTVDSYIYFRTLMESFVAKSKFEIKLYVVSNLTQREKEQHHKILYLEFSQHF